MSPDINVYESGFTPESHLMRVLVSQDGVVFTDISAQRGGVVQRIPGDIPFADIPGMFNYDLGDMPWVRYVRIQGLGTGLPGGHQRLRAGHCRCVRVDGRPAGARTRHLDADAGRRRLPGAPVPAHPPGAAVSRLTPIALGALATLLPLTAAAATPPVTVGSTYGLYLYSLTNGQSPHDVSAVQALVFDGRSESFQRTVTLSNGRPRNIDVQVDEEQFFQDGLWTVRIHLQSAEELYPTGDYAVHGLGSVVGNPLDLDQPFRLVGASTSLHAGDQLLVHNDWSFAPATQFQADPWDGYFIQENLLATFIGVNGLGGNHVTFEMQLAPVPEPAPLALMLAGLSVLAWRARGARA